MLLVVEMCYLLGSIAKIIITFIRNRVLSQTLYVLGSKISSFAFDCKRKRYGVADLLKCARPFNIKGLFGLSLFLLKLKIETENTVAK